MRAASAALGGLLVLSPLLPSCIVYDRDRIDEPIPEAVLATLQPGQELGDCLRRLGAPKQVYEYRGDGMALLWAWLDSDVWRFDISLPLQEHISASFDLDLGDAEASGCLLWFGPDLRLERFRQGRLGDLLPQRSRPREVEPAGG